MNGVHDLGGMDGFGSVDVEANEPVFHLAWERTVFALAAATSAQHLRNVHQFRHAIERMAPAHYLESTYYEHWLTGMTTLLVELDMLTRTEVEARVGGRVPWSQAVRGSAPLTAPSSETPRFSVGSPVVVRNIHPVGHTRCPRYVRGKRGVVLRVDARFPLPDVAAHSTDRCAQYTYNVRFDALELWGVATNAAVHVDLWESYLEDA